MTLRRYDTFLKLFFFIFILQSCATKHLQINSKTPAIFKENFDTPTTSSHTFYLIGDAGDSDSERSKKLFTAFEYRLKQADSSSTLLFLGDNIYPKGIPLKNSPKRKSAEEKLNRQLDLSKSFKGKTIFIPGNHDWYSGIDGLASQEMIVNSYFKSKKAFLPSQNCAIDCVNINSNVALIVIDSQWFLEDWNKHSTINENCDIKTRDQFFEELETQINKNQKKTTIIAMHHPLMSNGEHGGQFSFDKQLFPFEKKIPLPVIATAINFVRKTSGILSQDLQNQKYAAFLKRIKTLIGDKTNIVVVSGHEHTLQYLEDGNIKQIISGAGSKEGAARAIHKKDFSYGHNGYAVLQILKTGASKVSFYGIDKKGKEKLLFSQQPLFSRPKPNLGEFPNHFATTIDTAIYTAKMTRKSRSYRFLWGNHFRKYYSMPVKVKVATLDTIFGGLKSAIEDDSVQFRSLLLTDKNGDEFVMRSLKKSATLFLQSVAFKDQSVEDDFKDTYTESFVMDFYTTSHPYTPMVIGKLADKINVNHTNPILYFIPKQNALGQFNENFGNELYLIEERPMNGFSNLRSFGKPPKIVGTDEVLINLQSDPKYQVDEKAYIRARLFDMLIGDWDRRKDQWRWGEYKENGKIIYRPIPIGRDQAFTKYDGSLLAILINMPVFRQMKSFSQRLKNVKWFNREGYTLDLALATKSNEEIWQAQAQYITDNLSDSEIDEAFEALPNEVKDATITNLKMQLKIRKTQLAKYAKQYYKILQKTALIVGTDKKDRFVVAREGNTTKVQMYGLTNDTYKLINEKIYRWPESKELWLYALGGEDSFEVVGNGNKIKLRLLGGQDKDTYTINNGRKVKIYDFKSAQNDISNARKARRLLSDDYQVNTYDLNKPKYNVFSGYPLIGFNPDDGIKMGAVINYTINGFHQFPYTQKHSIKGNYYFATSGFELSYKGIFPRFSRKWDLIFDALYTSPNFAANFFGLGNETQNQQNILGLDYNRVKIRTLSVSPSLQWIGEDGGSVVFKGSFERISVDKTPRRYISLAGNFSQEVFNYKNFADINAAYKYENFDNNSNPSIGMTFSLLGGFKINVDQAEKQFSYAESSLGFTHKLVPSAKFVVATMLKGKVLFNNHYEFYQAATVGGDTDLRGFRNQRFSGRQSFYQSTDLRWNIGKLRNGLAPLSYGVFSGFDYGRVWLKDDFSDKWHQSAGGGVWINGVNLLTAKLSYFYSEDGGRFSFALGFGF